VVPLLLDAVQTSENPPTLIFTSATAAMKGSALCSSFATGKFAMRALAQSLAREFGPKGVHVNHAIIDGVIDIERTKDWKFEHEDAKIKPEAVRSHVKSTAMSLACTNSQHNRSRTHTGGYIYSREHASQT
jgi:NAD(P)-dependent dehydrogenase (short-subunit alcohol dehydrogenase family)